MDSSHEEDFDEVFHGPGFVMARKGRFIIQESTAATEEERHTLLQALSETKGEVEEQLKSQVGELEAIIQDHNPLDIIANIALRNSIWNPEDYKEYRSQENPAYAEYIALLCLTKPYETYHYQNPEPFPPNFIEDMQERVKKLFFNQTWWLAVKDLDPNHLEPPDMLTKFRFDTLLRSLIVRYMTYHHHLIELLKEIFSSLKNEMVRMLGFTIDDTITILEGIEDLSLKKLSDRRQEALEFEKKLRKAVKSYRRKRKINDILKAYPKDLLERLTLPRPSESVRQIQAMAINWTFYTLGETLSFTATELAEHINIEQSRVEAFLRMFSIHFGEVEERYRYPAPTHPMMRKPIIHNDDRYYCPVFQSAYWSIRPAIEEYWNPASNPDHGGNAQVWEKYIHERSDFLEEKAIKYLSDVLRYAAAYRKLKYRYRDENGVEIEAELDGLLLLDNAIFLVEAKSGTFSAPARRGAPKRMQEELRELVGEAYSQAMRAKKYITESDKPSFRLEDGGNLIIEMDKYNQIFLVTVTLDHLDSFVTNVYQLKELGIFQEDEYPWAVSLTDLRVISEILENSSQFVHFIKRRLHLNELGWVQAHDELDWLGHYLLEGLFFDEIKEQGEGPFVFNLLSYSWIFDDYYFFITGQRNSPVEKPSQKMPPLMQVVLRELEVQHQEGYLDAACALMDMSGQNREDFFRYCEEFRRKTLKDRGIHDISIPFSKGGFGVTFMFSPIERSSEFPDRLIGYCQMKKYQTKVARWIGFACIADTPGWVDYVFILDNEWVFDEELEKQVNKYLPPLAQVQ